MTLRRRGGGGGGGVGTNANLRKNQKCQLQPEDPFDEQQSHPTSSSSATQKKISDKSNLKYSTKSSYNNDEQNKILSKNVHSFMSKSIWIRKILISLSIMFLIYLLQLLKNSLNDDSNTMTTMASCQENLSGSPIGLTLGCDQQDYVIERTKFERCCPKRCGRFVSDSIVSDRESLELRVLAETVFSLIQTRGGVAIFDLTTGALSNDTQFIDLYKLMKRDPSKQVVKQKNLNTFRTVKDKIIHTVSMNFGIESSKLFLTSPAFFTRIDYKKDLTLNDQYWHPHIDKNTYGGFVYTSLLYLSTYQDEFNGGRFIFLDPGHNTTIEPRFGRVSFFTSGSENKHMVEKVSSGARFALTIPFTCDPKKEAKIPNI